MVEQNTPKRSVTFSLHLLRCINAFASLMLLISEGPQFLLSVLESAYGKVLHTLGVSFPPHMVSLGDTSLFANPVYFGWE